MTMTTVPMAEFRDGLRSVIPGAEKASTTTPLLNAVHVKLTPGELILQATDRRVAMEYTLALPEYDENRMATFTMRLEDAKRIVQAIPARGPEITVALTAKALTMQGHGVLVVDVGRFSALTLAAVEGEYPALGRLFKTGRETRLEAPLGLGVKQLAQLTTATKHLAKDPGLLLSPGATPTEPVMVTVQGIAPWRALIMPRRY